MRLNEMTDLMLVGKLMTHAIEFGKTANASQKVQVVKWNELTEVWMEALRRFATHESKTAAR